MKEFMLLFLDADYEKLNLSPEEMQAQMGKWFAWIDELRAQDAYVDGRPLTTGTKLVKGSTPVITDGPFAESKEVVGGYFIVRAPSIEHAAELAKRYPDFDLGGSVEVREVAALE